VLRFRPSDPGRRFGVRGSVSQNLEIGREFARERMFPFGVDGCGAILWAWRSAPETFRGFTSDSASPVAMRVASSSARIRPIARVATATSASALHAVTRRWRGSINWSPEPRVRRERASRIRQRASGDWSNGGSCSCSEWPRSSWPFSHLDLRHLCAEVSERDLSGRDLSGRGLSGRGLSGRGCGRFLWCD
jgi:hypothetical protein